MRTMTYFRALVASAAVATAACSSSSLNVGNPNSPNIAGAPNARAAVQLAVTGILAQARSNWLGWGTTTGSYGREYYLMQAQFGGVIFGPYRDWPLFNGNGAGLWSGYYTNLRNAQSLLTFLDTVPSANYSDQFKAGARGFARTFYALELLYPILARDSIGAVTTMPADAIGLAPFVSRDSVYRFISNTLDQAQTDLQGAGGTFSFALTTGYSGFGVAATTPAGFILFNRALKARVEAYRGSLGCGTPCYQAALTALNASFFAPVGIATLSAANLQNGIWHLYSIASGDVPNNNAVGQNQFVYANPSIRDDGRIPGVTSDLRYVAKIRSAPSSTVEGVTSNIQLQVFRDGNSPAPIIRREELVLLYAEAQYFTGNATEALNAINAIRTVSGGLTARGAFADAADFRTELINQRRLSLLFEGHRWVDTRRLLGYAGLPPIRFNEPAAYTVATRLPVPQLECDARRLNGDAAVRGPGCP
ncbi:MAG: RagB/SusD family nutrient uptake outer membrane protein [Gemmatimonadales bacterium]|nr:RagB/SusD family nutrient uptake outer membrane protein [Gemmatimonadales bacterium]